MSSMLTCETYILASGYSYSITYKTEIVTAFLCLEHKICIGS